MRLSLLPAHWKIRYLCHFPIPTGETQPFCRKKSLALREEAGTNILKYIPVHDYSVAMTAASTGCYEPLNPQMIER